MFLIKQTMLYFCIFYLLLSSLAEASPYYGIQFAVPIAASEPAHLQAYQLMLNYDPNLLKWRQFNLYFDGGFSHLWVKNISSHTTLNIYSIAPIIRYTFKKQGRLLPYFELSIGLSYLTRTRLAKKNLGIHFAFQDRIGIGAILGTSERFSIGIQTIHYSNAHLSDNNSGITMPLVLDIGYRFN